MSLTGISHFFEAIPFTYMALFPVLNPLGSALIILTMTSGTPAPVYQQLCKKTLSKVPYFHLLPRAIYKGLLKLFKESEEVIPVLLEIKDTGISIERFEKIVKKTNYSILGKIHYLFNPIYEYKFNIKPKKQNKFVTKIPYIRNYVTTCVYYIITSK